MSIIKRVRDSIVLFNDKVMFRSHWFSYSPIRSGCGLVRNMVEYRILRPVTCFIHCYIHAPIGRCICNILCMISIGKYICKYTKVHATWKKTVHTDRTIHEYNHIHCLRCGANIEDDDGIEF